MARSFPLRLALASLLALSGCASVEMSLEDVPGSDVTVTVTSDTPVYVAPPTLTKAAAVTLDEENHPRAAYTVAVQRAMVRALERRGVTASTSRDGTEATLRIKVTGFGRGSGFSGFFLRGGIDYSTLDGTAILETPRGKRALAIEQAGGQSGTSDAADHTAENIGSFTAAIAERMTG